MNEPFQDFAGASRAVLDFLRVHVPLSLWMVTRTDGQRWVVLNTNDRGYGVKPGDVLPYADSLCAQRLACNAPDIAPDVDQVEAYRSAPARRRAPIGAYISLPLQLADGTTFGTLCAIDPQPQRQDLLQHQALLKLLACQLATILRFDLAREDAWRHALLAMTAAETDPMTGCLNRRGWEQHCAKEEQRCRDLGSALAVLVLDLDGLKAINDSQGHASGDAHILRAAQVMNESLLDGTALARLGGDEFAVLLPNATADSAIAVRDRLRDALDAAGIPASIGVADRKPYRDIPEAWRRADQAMYADKIQRKNAS